MAKLFTTGFENGVEWGTTNDSPTIVTTRANRGGSSLRCNPATAVQCSIAQRVYAADDAAAHVYMRAYVYVAAAPAAITALMAWGSSATSISGFYGVKMLPDRTLIITNSTGTTGGTATAAIPLNTWTRIEFDYNDATDTGSVYINGVLGTSRTGIGLSGGSYARFGVINPTTADIYFDDLAVNDSTGTSNNGLPGPVGQTVALGRAREKTTAGPLTARPATPTADLVDTFDDGIVDPVLWPESYGGVTEADGRAQVPCGLDYAAYASAPIYTLRNSQLSCRMYPAPIGDSLVACWTQVLIQTTTAGTDVVIEHNAITSSLGMALRTGYYDPDYLAIPYDPVQHAYLRIRQTGTDLLWETSPDGATWTTRRTSTAPAWVSDPDLQVQLIAHRDDGTPGVAEFDDVNVAPTTVVVPLGTAQETATARAWAGAKQQPLLPAAGGEHGGQWDTAKTASLTPAADTETSRPLTVGRTVRLGTAREHAAGQLLAAGRTVHLGTAGDRAAGEPITVSGAVELGQAGDAASARPLGSAKTSATGIATTVDSGRPVAARKQLLLGTATTTDTAHGYTTAGETRLEDARASDRGRPVTGSKTTTLRLAAGGDDALPVTAAKTRPLGDSVTVDQARPLTAARVQALTAAREQAGAGPLASAKHLPLGTATDRARARMLHLRSSGDIGTAWDTEEATRLTPSKQVLLGTASATETSTPLDAGHTVPAGTAAGGDRAVEVAAGKRLRLGVARCTEQVTTTTAGKRRPLLRATSTEAGGRIRQPFQTRRLHAAHERARAASVAWVKERPADELTSTVTGPALTPSVGGPQLTASVSGPSLTAASTGGG
ncbi:hypothetical protein [Streptomyces sp. SID5910]|uniref:hypothetical protein n=1 Tax=Streptomyces sp. SID5910 TaxID=2690312 RepID=UPI00136FC696|nr:hypothetical protein [Streptomyces sp. SID5910]MYR45085.1 hypothetical protein [Streptomyces sp. SID5910]